MLDLEELKKNHNTSYLASVLERLMREEAEVREMLDSDESLHEMAAKELAFIQEERARTEKQIQDSLFELIKNKTTIIIAHRLSTLLNMDRILVFDKGRIIQDGTHQTLLMEGGLYKELWDAQVRDFLPKVRETEIREFGIIQDHNKVIENFAKAI